MAQTIKDQRTRRLAVAGLLVVCGLMVLRLVLTAAGVWGGPGSTAAPSTPAPASGAAPSAARGPSAGQGPAAIGREAASLHLEELAQLNGRPLPDFERNPFQYGPTPEEIKAQKHAEDLAKNPPPPVAPPPPPVPFRAIGYQQAASGQRVAYLCVAGGGASPAGNAGVGGGGAGGCAEDQEPYAVREGQEFGQHFKVLRITDSMVEVQDESYHQTVQLPFPQ